VSAKLSKHPWTWQSSNGSQQEVIPQTLRRPAQLQVHFGTSTANGLSIVAAAAALHLELPLRITRLRSLINQHESKRRLVLQHIDTLQYYTIDHGFSDQSWFQLLQQRL
jgi:hypothetical protein